MTKNNSVITYKLYVISYMMLYVVICYISVCSCSDVRPPTKASKHLLILHVGDESLEETPGGPPHDQFGQHSGVQFEVQLLSPRVGWGNPGGWWEIRK